MGLFDFWRAPALESPWADTSNLETLTLANLYGLTPDTLPMNRSGAMAIPSLAKGRNLICGAVSRLPLVALKGTTPVATQPSFLQQLQTGVPNIVTLAWAIDGMIFHGRAWFLISARLTTGQPSALQLVPEADADVEDGVLVRAFGKPVKRSDVIRIDAIHEGILNFGRDALREAATIERLAAEVGANPVPNVVLKQREGADLTREQRDELLAGWRAARTKKGGSVAFVNKAIDAEAFGQAAENLLIDGRNQSSLQMSRLLGLPAWAVDASVQGQSLSYSNQASRNRELLDAVNPFIEAIEQTLSMWLPYGTQAKFDTSELLLDDTKTRYESLAVAISAGILTPNEARARENLAPLDEPAEPAKTEQDTTDDQDA